MFEDPANRERIYCTLLTTHALSIIAKHTQNLSLFWDSIRKDADRFGHYPDGSLLIEGGDSFHRLWNMICGTGLMSHGVWQPHGFGGLEQFPDEFKAYMLFYAKDYRESLGELDFGIAFPSMWAHPTNDYDLKNLQISVAFKRNASREVKLHFVQFLKEWFVTVSEHGVFGEGPVKPTAKEIEFRGRLVQFRIDASSSGQDTLNWLVISALNFGYTVSKVTDFIFDHDQKVEIFTGPISGKIERIPIS